MGVLSRSQSFFEQIAEPQFRIRKAILMRRGNLEISGEKFCFLTRRVLKSNAVALVEERNVGRKQKSQQKILVLMSYEYIYT